MEMRSFFDKIPQIFLNFRMFRKFPEMFSPDPDYTTTLFLNDTQ